MTHIAEMKHLISRKEDAVEWAQDQAEALLCAFTVWWVMGADQYLVYAEGVRPESRHVVKEVTVEPK